MTDLDFTGVRASWDAPETRRPQSVTAQLHTTGVDPETVRKQDLRIGLELLDGVFWAGGQPVAHRPLPLDEVRRHWEGAELLFEVPIDDALDTRYVRLHIDGRWRWGVPISRRALRQDLDYVATPTVHDA